MEVRRPQKTKVNVPEPKVLKLTNHIPKDWKKFINPIHITSFKMNLLYLKNLSYAVLLLKRSSPSEAFIKSRQKKVSEKSIN